MDTQLIVLAGYVGAVMEENGAHHFLKVSIDQLNSVNAISVDVCLIVSEVFLGLNHLHLKEREQKEKQTASEKLLFHSFSL